MYTTIKNTKNKVLVFSNCHAVAEFDDFGEDANNKIVPVIILGKEYKIYNENRKN